VQPRTIYLYDFDAQEGVVGPAGGAFAAVDLFKISGNVCGGSPLPGVTYREVDEEGGLAFVAAIQERTSQRCAAQRAAAEARFAPAPQALAAE
jgi:hypothetical protein